MQAHMPQLLFCTQSACRMHGAETCWIKAQGIGAMLQICRLK
jgi:hypothetical protein